MTISKSRLIKHAKDFIETARIGILLGIQIIIFLGCIGFAIGIIMASAMHAYEVLRGLQ